MLAILILWHTVVAPAPELDSRQVKAVPAAQTGVASLRLLYESSFH